ncbi:acetyl-CoA carboxylase carboxyl transferase subunit alpha, partial [Lactobacillus delbrueckii subsp. lactis]
METVRAARASDKLSAHYLRAHLFSDFVELHGDRQGA